MPKQNLHRPAKGPFRQKEGLCLPERTLCHNQRAHFRPTEGPFRPNEGPIRPKEAHYKPTRGPFLPTKGLPNQQKGLLGRWNFFRSKDLPRNLTSDHVSPTNGSLQVAVALACIGVAPFEVGVARATPKVYKYPPLITKKAKRTDW